MANEGVSVVLFGLGLFGLGWIGRAVGRALAARGYRLLAGVDIDPSISSKSLGEVLGLPSLERRRVFAGSDALFERLRPDVVVLSTSSRLAVVAPQMLGCVRHGVSVVTTCEELASPPDPAAAAMLELEQQAREASCSVVATGINPGFVTDSLPLFLCSPCLQVDRIRVRRVLDADHRRGPFRRKFGVGLTLEEFQAAALGHIGLEESARLLADYLGWEISGTSGRLEPAGSRPRPTSDTRRARRRPRRDQTRVRGLGGRRGSARRDRDLRNAKPKVVIEGGPRRRRDRGDGGQYDSARARGPFGFAARARPPAREAASGELAVKRR